MAIILSATGTAYYYDLDEDEGDPVIDFDAESEDYLEIHFIDVRQGDSTLMITPSGYSILVDGGNNGRGHEVANYIQGLGIDEIDLMVATHPDADHIGGLDEIISTMPVNHVMDNGQEHPNHTKTYQDHMIAIEGIERTIVREDILWVINDDTRIEVIVPYDDGAGLKRDLNSNSILIKTSYGGTSVLLTGDCEKICENRILAGDIDDSIGDDINVDILKVGHHGSETSTSDEFLSETDPTFAVISVGKNQWGLPKDSILEKLEEHRADVYRTDENGTIIVTIDENGNVLLGLFNEQ